MVLSPRSTRPAPRAERQPAVADAVVWHDLECGSYSADLPLWRELAGAAPPDDPGPVLEIGAGTGRVALALAREGVRVTALERDPELLDALAARAGELPVEPVLGDARELALDRRGESNLIVD